MKLQTSLGNWGGIICNCVTDEEIGDIKLAIKYEDHGDDFLYVRTYSEEEYEYGYWFNRKTCFTDFDPARNNGESDEYFIKRPILFKEPQDRYCTLSNNIHRIIERYIMDYGWFIPKKSMDPEYDIKYALINILEEINNNQNTMYDFNSYKKYLYSFITKNDLGEEWINKVNSIKWDSKINGFDGIAGKREACNYLTGDRAIKVLYRGKDFDIKKLTYSAESRDYFGCTTYCLNTHQFA